MLPTSIAPSSSTWPPSVNDSRITFPMGSILGGGPGTATAVPSSMTNVAGAAARWRIVFASSTAITIAGDSISAIAAAMWPPGAMPRDSR